MSLSDLTVPGINYPTHFQITPNSFVVRKGTNPEVDSYSAFYDVLSGGDTGLAAELARRGVLSAAVCGLATDYCVGDTALDALRRRRMPTLVLLDAARGVDARGSVAKMAEVVAAGGVVVRDSGMLWGGILD